MNSFAQRKQGSRKNSQPACLLLESDGFRVIFQQSTVKPGFLQGRDFSEPSFAP
jgi:hypothetical protein